jgi:serine phosphatase RsbU (regulator of sigma subunit)/putative methionine-R-sulfoxide reductase with GAF domain
VRRGPMESMVYDEGGGQRPRLPGLADVDGHAPGVDRPERIAALRASGLLDHVEEGAFDRLARVAARLLEAPVSLVAFVDEDRQVFRGCVGLAEPIATTRETPLSHSFCQHVVAQAGPLVVPDARRHPTLRDNLALRDLQVVAYLGVPLRDRDGEVLGAFCVIDHRPREWTREEVALLEDLATAAMTEIALVQAVVEERRVRGAERRANRQLRHLLEAGEILSASLDYEQTLDNVVRLLVPDHADWCVIDVVRAGEVRRMSLAADGQRQEAARTLLERYPPRIDAPAGVGRVLRTGVTALVPSIDDTWIRQVAQDDEHARLIADLGVRSAAIIPMRVGRTVVGALSLVSGEADRYDEALVPFLEELATRVGLAVENAWLYRERDRIATTLQASLLPAALPQLDGFVTTARYHAARGGSEVGGDFYDLFAVGGGRWLAVVGDVRGKGVPAAALTGLARHTIRGAALNDPDPASVLRTLNRALLMEAAPDNEPDPRFCTVVCALIAPREGGAALTVACAGHPPALIVRSTGGVDPVGRDGTLLGVLPDVEIVERRAALHPGDTLFLHTDGLTDARSDTGEFFGDGRLRAALHPPPADARDAAARATDAALRWQAGQARDDIAVLAISLDGAAPTRTRVLGR